MREYFIPACGGAAIVMAEGETVTVIDVEGGQVADFFAERAGDTDEFLSPAVTIDCNESLRLHIGDCLYTNLYRPMFQIIYAEVGKHACCFPAAARRCMPFSIRTGTGTPIAIIQPINLFMFSARDEAGIIAIHPPVSSAGNKIILQAKMDVRLGIAACSVSEGACNSRRCSPIKVVVESWNQVPNEWQI